MHIPEDGYGKKIIIDVQRRQPTTLVAARSAGTPLFVAGPRCLVHMRNDDDFDSSGDIPLPRTLARTGSHSYFDPTNCVYHAQYELSLLDARGDVEHNPDGQDMIVINLHLQPAPAAGGGGTVEAARKRFFQSTSPPTRDGRRRTGNDTSPGGRAL